VRLTNLNRDYVKAICQEYSITNAHITFYEDSTPEDLIDALLGNCQYIPAIIIVNKIDVAQPAEKERLFAGELLAGEDFITVSGITMEGIDDLRQKIYDKLDLIRVYLKPRVKEIDFEKPMIMKKGSTIRDACNKIHKDFVNQFRFAKVWGKSAKHPGQVVQIKHVLEDEDILCIFLRK
jgi:ribosome-interacting GTPase 1